MLSGMLPTLKKNWKKLWVYIKISMEIKNYFDWKIFSILAKYYEKIISGKQSQFHLG